MTQAQQSSVMTAAEEEAVKRQEATILLRKSLSEAQKAETKGALAQAANLYEQTLRLVQQIAGVGVQEEYKQAVDGLTRVRLELAVRAKEEGKLEEALTQTTRALNVNPENEEVLKMRDSINKLIASRAGLVPSKEVQAQVPEYQTNLVANRTLVQDGRLLLEMGKLEKAEEKLLQAAKNNPDDKAAYYYLSLIKQKKYEQEARKRELFAQDSLVEVEDAWNVEIDRKKLPTPNPFARTNLVHTGPGRQDIQSKLGKIILDEVQFERMPLSEVVLYLSEQSVKRDPTGEGINFMINSELDAGVMSMIASGGAGGDAYGQSSAPAYGAQQQQQGQFQPQMYEPPDLRQTVITIDPPLRNITLGNALDAIVKSADSPIKYTIEEYAIILCPRTIEAEQLHTRTFKLDPNTFVQGLQAVTYGSGGMGGGGGYGGGGMGGGGYGGGGLGGGGGYGGGGGF
ncbi:MAG: hypothetical protein K9N52_07430, partial [Verrucomicrobia bacterium]|nr:hypothetical protein [Verrucomicrobiota bacterium]